MTKTLAMDMGDTLKVYEEFKEAIVRIAELEAEKQNLNDCLDECRADAKSAERAMLELETLGRELETEVRKWKLECCDWQDVNTKLESALCAIKEAGSKGEARRIASQALDGEFKE